MLEFNEYENNLLNTLPSKLNIEEQFIRKKLKQRIVQKKYRDSLTNTVEKKKEYNNYHADYIQKYRTKKKIELLDAISKTSDVKETKIINKTKKILQEKIDTGEIRKSSRVSIPVDNRIIQVVPKRSVNKSDTIKIVKPTWLTELTKAHPNFVVGDKNFVRFRAISENLVNPDITVVVNLLRDLYETKASTDIKRVLRSIFNGNDIKGDVKYIKNELKFLNKDKIYPFLDMLEEYYPNIHSFNKPIRVLTNITSRIESYKFQYQVLTNIGIKITKEYMDNKGDNIIKEQDKDKFQAIKSKGGWDYKNVDQNNNWIKNSNLSIEEQAIASVFLCSPPRRLDHQHMVLTDIQFDIEKNLNDKNLNYLIMDGDTPTKFVYNKFKTESKGGRIKKVIMGQQILNVYEEVIPYLKQHIKTNKIKLRDYLFGSNTYSTLNSAYGKMVEQVMLKIFKVNNITSGIIRQVASIYNQTTPNRSSNTKKSFALEMGHSENTNQLYSKIVDSEDETNDVPDVKTKEEIFRDKQVLKKNKIPIVKKVEQKIETTAIVDDNIRRSTRNRNRSL